MDTGNVVAWKNIQKRNHFAYKCTFSFTNASIYINSIYLAGDDQNEAKIKEGKFRVSVVALVVVQL